MSAKDTFKRSVSFFFNDYKPLRTVFNSLLVGGVLGTGYFLGVDNDPSSHSKAPEAVHAAALQSYLAEAEAFEQPDVVGAEGWRKLDVKIGNFADRVLLDGRLSETDVAQIIAATKEGLRFSLPDHTWLGDTRATAREMNALDECGHDIGVPNLTAKALYQCAVRREDNNEFISMFPGMLGGLVLMMLLGIGAGSAGRRWEWERENEERRRREKETTPPPAPAPAVETPLVPPKAFRQPKFD